jgi:hypothetical protein
MSADNVVQALRASLADPNGFSVTFQGDRRLRAYQRAPAVRIAAAVDARVRGIEGVAGDFAVVFSRQAGKDEMLAQLVAFLLVRYSRLGGQVVLAMPAMSPQGVIMRDRLVERLRTGRLRELGIRARTREGSIVQVGRASAHFVSAAPTASARGQTASLLLVANETQDIEPDRWDAVFAPMAASTNAVTLYLGTVWSASTLLARQTRYLRELERDGHARVFLAPWGIVSQELPAYGDYVRRQIAQLGAEHPFIQTEYELVELDGAGGLFPPSRRGQMAGDHPPLTKGIAGETYALLLDVAGEEEDATDGVTRYDPHGKRDSTALTVVRVTRGEDRPRYEVVRRYLWTGTKHTELHAQIVDLARSVWRARYLVVDATGVGAGLASFLTAALGAGRVLPFVFSLSSKSQLGWDYLGVVDSGRFKDHAPHAGDREAASLARIFWRQVAQCEYEVRPGPGKLMSWAVPDPKVHDDLLISAALCAVLDGLDWRPRVARGGTVVDQ